jgi:surfactin synthase thioesterase subunit/glycosyltransferase involved in cell wall biosynthesis
MRILLAQNSLYYPAHGGGDRSNRLLVEALAARSHVCRVVARLSRFGDAEQEQYLRELASRKVAAAVCESGVVSFAHEAVEARVVTSHPNLRAYFVSQIAKFRPDVILTSTDDPAQLLLEASLRANVRTVYMARATLAVPFGPDCAFPSAAKTEMLRQTDAVVGVSQYVADYIRRWSGIPAVHVPISLLDPSPYPDLGRFDNDFVTLVNPCAVKGISIFLELAGRMPSVRFAAVPTWGTNEVDRAALARHPNVTVLDPVDNVEDILRRTRVLLAPSLWAEARSRIVVEAMLRGVPVIASEIGGIPEAKLGVDYLLPVRPIEKYQARLDEQMVPVAEVPPQDIRPWHAALERLLTGRAHYEALSRASREAALDYAAGLSVEPFAALLERVVAKPKAMHAAAGAPAPSALDRLSPDRRKLLELRLRKASATVFAGVDSAPGGALRLFCFPHAGGGPAAFARWGDYLPASVALAPARPPRRKDMAEVVAALAAAIEPHLGDPFAFFGHSMGAVVAFELARLLRRRNQPLPRLLLVSAARAPQFRRGHVPPPEPSEAEFLDELRRLEGVPPEVLDSPELVRLLLPGLRADASLYRNYIYSEESPLTCPIRAYGGAEDPNVGREHLNGWACQTTASFGLRLFPGGHFFLETAREEFLRILTSDLVS